MRTLSHFHCAVLAVLITLPARGADWPSWRGPEGTGVTSETDLPLKWSATENIVWKVPLPGPGNSSPVVARGRVFLTGAEGKGAVRSLMCFDRADGKLLWRRDTRFTGQEPTHDTNPYCSASPATDGRRVFASHGSAGVVAYDIDGKPLWRRDLGPFRHIWGNASSPVLYKNTVILQCGPGPQTRMVALNADSGETIWENALAEAKPKAPDEWKGSWSTPVVHREGDGTSTLITSLPRYVAGFDPDTGKERWRCRGLSDLVYTNPLVGGGFIVCMSGYQGPAMGMRLPKASETGDLTTSHRLWVVEKGNPQRVGTGVIAGGHAYILNETGVAECIELETGKQVWKDRAANASWGSMVLAGDKIYVTDMKGQTVVLRAVPKFELLHENELAEGDLTRASPAISDGQIFLRTYRHLYCVGTPSKG